MVWLNCKFSSFNSWRSASRFWGVCWEIRFDSFEEHEKFEFEFDSTVGCYPGSCSAVKKSVPTKSKTFVQRIFEWNFSVDSRQTLCCGTLRTERAMMHSISHVLQSWWTVFHIYSELVEFEWWSLTNVSLRRGISGNGVSAQEDRDSQWIFNFQSNNFGNWHTDLLNLRAAGFSFAQVITKPRTDSFSKVFRIPNCLFEIRFWCVMLLLYDCTILENVFVSWYEHLSSVTLVVLYWCSVHDIYASRRDTGSVFGLYVESYFFHSCSLVYLRILKYASHLRQRELSRGFSFLLCIAEDWDRGSSNVWWPCSHGFRVDSNHLEVAIKVDGETLRE